MRRKNSPCHLCLLDLIFLRALRILTSFKMVTLFFEEANFIRNKTEEGSCWIRKMKFLKAHSNLVEPGCYVLELNHSATYPGHFVTSSLKVDKLSHTVQS